MQLRYFNHMILPKHYKICVGLWTIATMNIVDILPIPKQFCPKKDYTIPEFSTWTNQSRSYFAVVFEKEGEKILGNTWIISDCWRFRDFPPKYINQKGL